MRSKTYVFKLVMLRLRHRRGNDLRLAGMQGVVSVWFHDLLLGTFNVGEDSSVEPPSSTLSLS